MADVLLFRRQYAQALASLERCIELDPNYADAHAEKALVLAYAGQPNEALDVLEKAMRLNPHYPFVYFNPLGRSYFMLGRYEDAIDAFQEGLRRNPSAQSQRMFLAASYAEAGRLPEAEWEVAELLTLDPDFSLAQVPEVAPFKDPEPLERLLDGLRKAGLT
jgi:adenylate cyclase